MYISSLIADLADALDRSSRDSEIRVVLRVNGEDYDMSIDDVSYNQRTMAVEVRITPDEDFTVVRDNG
jgi:hypothetical protein